MITCNACGEKATNAGHGWCNACYGRWRAAGKPESGPPPRRGHGRRDSNDQIARKRRTSKPCSGWDDAQGAAARKVADLAAGPDDCRYLLDALGLLPEGVGSAESGGAA